MIDNKEVKKLAQLARIDVSDKELNKIRDDLDAIIQYVHKISAVAPQNESVTYDMKNVFREDGVCEEDTTLSGELLDLAPNKKEGYIRVRKVIDPDI